MNERFESVTDVVASHLRSRALGLRHLREAAAENDDRISLLPLHALEALLEEDDRFVSESGMWRLADDAPVPGARGRVIAHDPADAPDASAQGDQIEEFVILDVEATSPNPAEAELIEIAAIRVVNWKLAEEFSTLVYAPEVPPGVSALTGIETPHLRAAPEAQDAVARLIEFVGDTPVLGQNVGYDIAVIQRVDDSFVPDTVLELLELAQVAFPTAASRSLDNLASLCNVDQSEAHRASADCETTLQVARHLVQRLNSPALPTQAIRALLGNAEHPWSRLLASAEMPDDGRWTSELASPWLQIEADPPSAPAVAYAFEPGGLIEKTIATAEYRVAQHEMAIEVEATLKDRSRLLVEAPTGTGKTFAYLIPAIAASARARNPIWISTHTKALQTQLQGDFDRLKHDGLIEGTIAVLKGQENYVCTRDLLAAAQSPLSPAAAVEVASLLMLLATAAEAELGELTDFWLTRNNPDAAEIRTTIRLNRDTCEGNNCDFINICPFFTARARAQAASVVAVNHALLVNDSLTSSPALLDANALVVDEAHTLEDAATNALANELIPAAVVAWLNRLIDVEHSKGLLRNFARGFGLRARTDPAYAQTLESVRRARKAIQLFATRLATYLGEFVGSPDPDGYPVVHRFRAGVDDRRFLFLEARQTLFTFSELVKELRDAAYDLLRLSEGRAVEEGFSGNALRIRLRAEAAHADEIIELCLLALNASDDSYVTFSTWEHTDGEVPRISVSRVPVDVSDTLKQIYNSAGSVIATSATLSVGGSFNFMRERLAADDFTASALPETFDYESQARLILTRHLPAPRANQEESFVEAVADTAVAAIGTSRGGTLGVFTSRKRTAATYELAEPAIRYEGLELRAQLPGTSTRELAEWFRTSTDASLFGVRSFWEGFDAPGDTLRSVLVEKIPFASPADPILEARSEHLEASGRDPFFDLAVPMAALAFKQGFGRLIRTKHDRGVVTVLDRRMRTGMTYVSEFLASLPEGVPISYPADEPEFLDDLASTLGVEPRHDLARGVGPRRAVADLAKTTIADPADPGQVRQALAAVRELFGIEEFRPGQEELIRAIVVDGFDAVGLLPTGAGKSLVYQAAAMCLDGVGLVISPLVALMKDQVDSLRDQYGFVWAHALYGGLSGAERDEIIDVVRGGGSRLLYISPERLRDPTLIAALASIRLSFVAVDEAHCVSVWGHDFRPDFLSIVPALGQLPGALDVPRVALTATAPGEVLDDILQQLRLRTPSIERRSVNRPNIHFSAIRCRSNKQKRSEMLRVVLAHDEAPGIVYCLTRKQAEAASALLRSHGISSRQYHGGMPAEQRTAVQEMFMSDQIQVICATNAFGLGVDKPDIGFVVHWSPTFSLDAYFQEAGRAARDTSVNGIAVLLHSPADEHLVKRLTNSTVPTVEEMDSLAHEIAALDHPFASAEALAEATGLDEISARVGVHLLQRAGALDQGLDIAVRAVLAIPTSFTRLLTRFGDETGARVREIAAAAGIGELGREVVDLTKLAQNLSQDPRELEQELLSLASQEAIGFRPFERAMELIFRTHDWDRDLAERETRRLRRSGFDRLQGMLNYAKGRGCRRRQILMHFDEPAERRCDACDECVGEPPQLALVDPILYADTDLVTRQVSDAVAGIVREASRLGVTPGRGSFEKALKGVRTYGPNGEYSVPETLQRARHFGALSYMTPSEISDAVDTLLQAGKLVAVEHALGSGGTYVGLDVSA